MQGRWGRILALIVSAVLCAVILEAGARAFWNQRHDVPLGSPDRILYAYYPELRDVDDLSPGRGDGFYDILVLGGSVLHPDWGDAVERLGGLVKAAVPESVRVFNLAMPAHTSRDSRVKYEALARHRFDLVVFYHGINETRANNVPADLFKSDYSHYSWYQIINVLAPYHDTASLATLYTLRFLGLRLQQNLAGDRYVPIHDPREGWVEFGGDIRTAAAFEDNLDTILHRARERGDPMLLMSFAIHIPTDYSREAFDAKQLDYDQHLSPVETWGRPGHVRNGVAAHNRVARRKPDEYPEIVFVDQARMIEGGAANFNDACHLTERGTLAFTRNSFDALRPWFETR